MRLPFALAALVSGLALPAIAETEHCAPRDLIVERLQTGYGEVFSGGGLQGEDAVFEVWVSEEKRTWTILMTLPEGMSCIMATGTDWVPPPATQRARGVKS
ncbi:MAG: hypothetical protein AAF366_18065 [Pseudomonadota bacterium]